MRLTVPEPPRWLSSILLFRWLSLFLPRDCARSRWYRVWQGGHWYRLRPFGAPWMEGFWTDHLPDAQTLWRLSVDEEEHHGF